MGITDVREVEGAASLSADVCIIGSGAAGITIAREFIGTGVSVLLLEGGGADFEPPSQDPYLSNIVGLSHGGIHKGRARVLGGTTTLWAGQALPLFDIDFQKRDWVPHSGWPIGRNELSPYYFRAESVMQLPHVTNDRQTWPSPEATPLAYDPDTIIEYFSQFTRTPSFAEKYRHEIAAADNIRLLTHANVISLEANRAASSLREVRVRSFQKQEIAVQARFFIVCCGGIESARLLLLSDSVERTGIGNRRDVVGRYFQDHPGISVPARPLDPKRFASSYDSFRKNGVRYSIKMVASEGLQRREKIQHMGAEVYYPSSEDDPITAAKDLLKIARHPRKIPQLPQALYRVLRRPGAVAGAAFRHYVRGQPPSVGSTQPHLGAGGEQRPNPDSRVMLGTETDSLGLRRTVLDWRMTSEDTRSFRIFLETVSAEWKRSGIAELDLSGVNFSARETGQHGGYIDSNHHMGTTRMGTDPLTSVVDSRCRVHGYDNLFVGSSSVFPTGGFSNPTLTVIALSLRIADDIKGQLPKSPSIIVA